MQAHKNSKLLKGYLKFSISNHMKEAFLYTYDKDL
jgi:hypothetical protein